MLIPETFQFKIPSLHSKISPISSTNKKINRCTIKLGVLKITNFETTGKSSTVSTSKIKKIITNMKNRMENGLRELVKGSKPHSKGLLFSEEELNL